MSTCDTCRKPGACCSGFLLSTGLILLEGWQQHAAELMVQHGLPFRPASAIPSWLDDAVAIVRYDCPKLGADGRCTDYENRPQTCHLYQPGEDRLCVEHVNQFRGIPIAVLQT